MPKLIVTAADFSTRDFEIASELTIGRNPGNHIQIDEEKASRTHCRVRPDGERMLLEDLKSSNGTKVNGRKIETYVLRDGDAISIGKTTLVYQDESTANLDRTMALPAISAPVAAAAVIAAVNPPAKTEREKEPQLSRAPAERDKPESSAAPRSDAPSSSKIPMIAGIVAVIVCGAVLVTFLNKSGKSPAAFAQQSPDEPAEPAAPPKPEPLKPPPIEKPAPPPRVIAPLAKPEFVASSDPLIAADYAKALQDRDKALASSNFNGARGALASFAAKYPGSSEAKRARKELQDTEALIDLSLSGEVEKAQQAAEKKKYRLAALYCTRLLSADGAGKFGAQARTLMNSIDAQTEARFTEQDGAVKNAIKAGMLDKAGEILEKALDELGGTKWAAAISEDQYQVLTAKTLLHQAEAQRSKLALNGKPISIRIESKKLEATLAKINGLNLDVKSGGISLSIPIRDVDPQSLTRIFQRLQINPSGLEVAYLWLLVDRPQNAQAEIELALQSGTEASNALRLISLLPDQKNLKIYDFSKWQHQSDWDAISGSWATQNDKLTLESADGGDISLKGTAIGGTMSAKNLRLSFDFDLQNSAQGYFFAIEFGTEREILTAIFSDKNVQLQGNVKAPASEKSEWKSGPTHVDISITDDKATFTINGKSKSLKIEGLPELQGTVTFRVRETACTIDNVILRNVMK